MTPLATQIKALIAAQSPQHVGYAEYLTDDDTVLQEVRNLIADRQHFLSQRDQRPDTQTLYMHGIIRRQVAQCGDSQVVTQAIMDEFDRLNAESRAVVYAPCSNCQATHHKLEAAKRAFAEI